MHSSSVIPSPNISALRKSPLFLLLSLPSQPRKQQTHDNQNPSNDDHGTYRQHNNIPHPQIHLHPLSLVRLLRPHTQPQPTAPLNNRIALMRNGMKMRTPVRLECAAVGPVIPFSQLPCDLRRRVPIPAGRGRRRRRSDDGSINQDRKPRVRDPRVGGVDVVLFDFGGEHDCTI